MTNLVLSYDILTYVKRLTDLIFIIILVFVNCSTFSTWTAV